MKRIMLCVICFFIVAAVSVMVFQRVRSNMRINELRVAMDEKSKEDIIRLYYTAIRNYDADTDTIQWNERERIAFREMYKEALKNWVENDEPLWGNRHDNVEMVHHLIRTSVSPQRGGVGVTDTDEGLALVMAAVEKANQMGMPSGGNRWVVGQLDGYWAFGMSRASHWHAPINK